MCVGERYTRYGKRLLLRDGDSLVRLIPRQWTDLADPDPDVVLGQGRALVRLGDLLELERLVRARVAEDWDEA